MILWDVTTLWNPPQAEPDQYDVPDLSLIHSTGPT